VLLIDDQAIVGEAVRRMIAGEPDVELVFCQDPTQAVARALELDPTVILQDLVMPHVDGVTLVRTLRGHERLRDIPLIVLSTKDEPRIKAECFDAGANDYLVKFPERLELLARLRYHSAGYRQLRRRIAEVLREHEDDHAQFSELLQIAPAIFANFVGEADAALRAVGCIVDAAHLDADAVTLALRETHTLKGNSRSLGLNHIAGRTHAVEELLGAAHKRQHLPDRADLAAALADLRRALDRAVSLRGGLEGGGVAGDASAVRAAALGEIADLLAEAATALPPSHGLRDRIDKALGTLERIARVPLSQLLPFFRSTAGTAASDGRAIPSIQVEIDDVAVTARVHAALMTAVPHLIRNAVVHGLEPADERLARGKTAAGMIRIQARVVGDQLVVDVHDDGRGIDRNRLAAALGNPTASLSELVFHPGLSSRHTADLDAGRGMGAFAARAAILAAGGTLAVESDPERGTTFTATVPLGRARRPTRG
jgi:chemotaxis protein histidine kinase CheA